jgi:O-antigen ligase
VAWPDFAPGDAGAARTAHNTFIQLVAELGVPALGLFLVALGLALRGLAPALKRRAADPLVPSARGLQCGLAGFAVSSLWGGIAFSWPLYLLLGGAFAAARLERTSARRRARSPHAAARLALAGAA